MAILVNKDTRVLIQGITGSEGARACREMLSYGTQVLAGVTPGKGGQSVENVSVYNSVREALSQHSAINASLVVVPARFCLAAATEAINAGIPLVNILTEHVPTQDSARLLALARAHNVKLVGMDFSDLLLLFAGDKDTTAVVMFGEVGGTYEEQAALMIKKGGFTKPM